MSTTTHPYHHLSINHPKYPHTPASYAFKQLVALPPEERPKMKIAESYTIVLDKQQLIMIEYALKLAMQVNPAIKNIRDRYNNPVVEFLHNMTKDTIDEPCDPNMTHGFTF